MNKSTFFSGQPIFAQLLRLIPKDTVLRIVRDSKADYYCKRFSTYEHLVTILYSIFNNCNSLREVTTGMLASEQRLAHLGVSDRQVIMGHKDIKHRVKARLVRYSDPDTGEVYEFVTNNLKMNGSTVAALYRKRWQIESLFKRMKQNYPLKYFLGDSENAIKIQIWCSLIADLLLKIVKKAAATKWSFSNLAAMVRLHLMTYIDLFGFLKSPEKSLPTLYSKSAKQNYNQLSFVT